MYHQEIMRRDFGEDLYCESLVWWKDLVERFGGRRSWCSGIVFHNKPPAFHTSNVWDSTHTHTQQTKKDVWSKISLLVTVELKISKGGRVCADVKEFVRVVTTITLPLPPSCPLPPVNSEPPVDLMQQL